VVEGSDGRVLLPTAASSEELVERSFVLKDDAARGLGGAARGRARERCILEELVSEGVLVCGLATLQEPLERVVPAATRGRARGGNWRGARQRRR
jgi:hypothetical protein